MIQPVTHKIAVVKGDGNGPEIVSSAMLVLDKAAAKYGFRISYKEFRAGGCAIDACGVPLPSDTLEGCKASDAILLGAVGGPKWDSVEQSLRPERALLGLRAGLGLYSNLRPALLFKELASASPLKDAGEIDILIVRELTGHGIGHQMHEDPQVPNYGRRGNGVMLKNSMCIAIEPMVTMGKRDIWLDQDRWTIRTRDGKPAAHFEHTVAVRKGQAEILSSFEEVQNIEGKLY